MTVAPAPPARISTPENRLAFFVVPAAQTPLPGLTPADDAAPVMPPASRNDPYLPSVLGSPPGSDQNRETAQLTWQALAPHLTRSPHMRLRRYNRTRRRHTYARDQPLTTTLPDRPAALRLFSSGGVAWSIALDFDPAGHGADAVSEHARDAVRFFRQLGGQVVADVAASGGRDLWMPLAVPITIHQAQQLTRRSAHDLIERALHRLAEIVPSEPHQPGPPAAARPRGARPFGSVHTLIALCTGRYRNRWPQVTAALGRPLPAPRGSGRNHVRPFRVPRMVGALR